MSNLTKIKNQISFVFNIFCSQNDSIYCVFSVCVLLELKDGHFPRLAFIQSGKLWIALQHSIWNVSV